MKILIMILMILYCQCYRSSSTSSKWNPLLYILFSIIVIVIILKYSQQHIDTTGGIIEPLELLLLLLSSRNDTSSTTSSISTSSTLSEKLIRQHNYFHNHNHHRYHQQHEQQQQLQLQSKQKDVTTKNQSRQLLRNDSVMTTNKNNNKSKKQQNRQLIIGGIEVSEPYKEYPYYAMPLLDIDYCGSVLIHPDIILTVAHCLDAFFLGIKIGLYNYTYYTDVIFTDFTYIQHPNYNARTYNNDIMVIRLQTQPKTFIPLAIWNTDPTIPADNDRVRTIGFGVTNISNNDDDYYYYEEEQQEELQLSTKMMQVDINVINFTSCYDNYVTNMASNVPINNTMICANDIGKDSCIGDSGGPLLQNITTYNNNTTTNTSYETTSTVVVIIGLVSWGEGCANILFPGIYTRISTYSDWIYDSIYSISKFSCPNDNRSARISKNGSYRCCTSFHCSPIKKSIQLYRHIPSIIYPSCIQCEDICISAWTTRRLRKLYNEQYKNDGWLYGKCTH